MSLEALALSANSWQLTTLKPYPSHGYPLTSMVSMFIWSCPVFSTLNVLFNVKFGSLSFKPKGRNTGSECNSCSHVLQAQMMSKFPGHVWCPGSTSSCRSPAFPDSAGSSPLTGPFRCQSLIMLIFYIRVSHPRHEMNIGTLNPSRSKSNNPESKSGCFLKNLKYSSLICTCAPTEILFLFLDLFTVESKCWNLCLGPVSNTHYLYSLLIMLLWF